MIRFSSKIRFTNDKPYFLELVDKLNAFHAGKGLDKKWLYDQDDQFVKTPSSYTDKISSCSVALVNNKEECSIAHLQPSQEHNQAGLQGGSIKQFFNKAIEDLGNVSEKPISKLVLGGQFNHKHWHNDDRYDFKDLKRKTQGLARFFISYLNPGETSYFIDAVSGPSALLYDNTTDTCLIYNPHIIPVFKRSKKGAIRMLKQLNKLFGHWRISNNDQLCFSNGRKVKRKLIDQYQTPLPEDYNFSDGATIEMTEG